MKHLACVKCVCNRRSESGLRHVLLQRETRVTKIPQSGGIRERWGTKLQQISEGSIKAITLVNGIPFHTNYMWGKIRFYYAATISACRPPHRRICIETVRCLEVLLVLGTFFVKQASTSVPAVQLGNWGQGGLQFGSRKKKIRQKTPIQLHVN